MSVLFAAAQALAQIVPGPVVPPSTYPGVEGQCEIAFGLTSSSHTVACQILTPGVDYTPSTAPRFVPIGKQLTITDVSAKCITAGGGSSGVYVSFAVLEADGYSKILSLQTVPTEASSVVRIGTFPAAMTARAGSQVVIRAVQNRNYTSSTSNGIVNFSGYLKNY
ncbi:MAG: hypothetical protein JNL62_12295 [Bryobacterales bacterium]|nr:hypothetical protein [Bryobacterales bacterium]